MRTLTPEQEESARGIIDILLARSKGMDEWERARFLYNHGVDDSASFAKDVAKKNPMQRMALENTSKGIRDWLIIPPKSKEPNT